MMTYPRKTGHKHQQSQTGMKYFFPSFIVLIFITSCSIANAQQEAFVFEYTEQGVVHQFNYLLFLPQGYGDDPAVRWPLIFYHHGAGENGDDVELLKVRGLPMIVEQQPDFPFIVLSPQVPSKPPDQEVWEELLAELTLPAWIALVFEIVETYAVDFSRVYMTGNSQGGTITWILGALLHEYLAAIAPLAAEGGLSTVCNLKDTPVWVFHGENDTLISPEQPKQMVEALEACGGDVRLTVYPNAGHNITGITYAGSELWDWFLSHSLGVEASVQPYGKLPSAWASIKNVR